MDSAAFIDEPTIIQRILYKEKSDLKSLAQKCLELEKSDYSKISQSQREDLIVSIQEDFNSLEQITEKQSILHELYLSEKEYHVARQEVLAKEIEKYVQEVAVLRQELENEKSQRANLLEYETYAKQINGLPRCEDTNEAIQKVMKMYGEVNELIGKKTEILKGTEKKSLEIMEQLKGLIEGTGEDCME